MTRTTTILISVLALVAAACGGGTDSETQFRTEMLESGFMTNEQIDCFIAELADAGLSVDDISDAALGNGDDLPPGASDALFTCLLGGDGPGPLGDSLGDGPASPGAGPGGSPTARSYGDDPTLDALWDACDAGDGQACDDLFFTSPFGSDYEDFGNTCGGRFDLPPVSCADELG